MRDKIREISLGDVPVEQHLIRFALQILSAVLILGVFKYLFLLW
jgi:hypothetical protein